MSRMFSAYVRVIFQHAPPLRGVTALINLIIGTQLFQPALPLRGVTLAKGCEGTCANYFNPHSPCGE